MKKEEEEEEEEERKKKKKFMSSYIKMNKIRRKELKDCFFCRLIILLLERVRVCVCVSIYLSV